MKKFKTPKILFAYVLMAIFGVGSIANAANTKISFEAMHVVRNQTNNETTYRAASNAKVGDTMRLMVWYHNKENENSGINAENLNIKVALPTTEGTGHVSTATVSGSNIDTIVDTAVINTSTKTKLEYVPGSATRKFNTGTNAVPNWNIVNVSDSIVGSGYAIASQKPCYNFEESIVISVRVVEAAKPVAPVCTITASPSSVEKGNSSTLTFNSTNATSGNIGGIGDVGISGNRNVTPTGTTTYTYSVGGPGGNATCQTTVTVTEPPIIVPPVTPPVTPPVVPPVVITGKGNVPLTSSGPAEAAAGAAGITAIGGASYAWMRSKKALLTALTKIK